ncbi:DUF2306 domain-containing protein [Leifsonia sp. 2MCAF36]|uniref:DUF2306 domain-containing protein n=1 Tax=Leifsonia sp. 2MCAF36 TaxID=3232988 RepID=UPI003F964D92
MASSTSRYRAVYGLVVVPSFVVAVLMAALYLVVMPLVPIVGHYYFSQQAQTYATYQVPLLIHIGAGAVALVLGPINLIVALRRTPGRRHRTIGKIYAVAVSVAATGAIFMSFHAYPGTITGGQIIVTSGFFLLGVAWLVTLALAVRAIAVKHDIAAHRFWIIANFSLTFVAVVLRAENAVLLATGTFETLYPFLPWTSGIPNLVIAMVLARKLNRQRARRTHRPRQPTLTNQNP